MFSNLRYLSLVIFGICVAIVLALSFYFKSVLFNNIVRASIEDEAKAVSTIYVKNIWNRYQSVASFLKSRPTSEWGNYPIYKNFQDESADLLQSSSAFKITVVSVDGDPVFYETNPNIVIKSSSQVSSPFSAMLDDPNKAIEATKHGLEPAMLNDAVVITNGVESKKKIYQISLLLKGSLPPSVNSSTSFVPHFDFAMIVINFDVTGHIRNIEAVQLSLILIFVTIFGVVTMAVFVASKKAETMFERQQELSVEMATAKASAEAESKAKSQFLANVSHELRTPLNAIIGFSEIINTEAMGPINNDQYKEFIKDIHTSGVHLLSLINDILDFSKADDNKLQVDLEEVELVKLAKICLRMVMPRAEEAKVKLVENLPSEAIVAIGDPKRLKQVILNLLSNSVKFTPEGGNVTLRVAKDGDANMVIIELSDSGVGMAAQDLAKALSPFGQVDNKLSKRYEGTGLGLPLTKKLVELMKGGFDIKSEPGLGTTVTIKIPLASNAINDSEAKKVVPPVTTA